MMMMMLIIIIMMKRDRERWREVFSFVVQRQNKYERNFCFIFMHKIKMFSIFPVTLICRRIIHSFKQNKHWHAHTSHVHTLFVCVSVFFSLVFSLSLSPLHTLSLSLYLSLSSPPLSLIHLLPHALSVCLSASLFLSLSQSLSLSLSLSHTHTHKLSLSLCLTHTHSHSLCLTHTLALTLSLSLTLSLESKRKGEIKTDREWGAERVTDKEN